MLTEEDKRFINENLYYYFHIVECNAPIFGEPFLKENYLYYYDGCVVTIISRRLKENVDEESLNNLIDYIVVEYNPDNVIVWGEFPDLKIGEQKGYILDSKKLELWKREFVLHTAELKFTKKYRKYLSKTKEQNLKLNFVDSKYFKHEHLRLLYDIHKDKNLNVRSLIYYCLYPGFENTKFVEVLKGDKILSINVIIDFSPRYVCFAEIGYDKEIKDCSGLSKALLFDY